MRRSADFERAVRRGARAGRSCLVIHVAPGGVDVPQSGHQPDEPPAIVGFVVSKSVGNAVTRNRVKRRLRALTAPLLADLAPGSAVVVRALPASANASFDELSGQLASAFRRASRGRTVPAQDAP